MSNPPMVKEKLLMEPGLVSSASKVPLNISGRRLAKDHGLPKSPGERGATLTETSIVYWTVAADIVAGAAIIPLARRSARGVLGMLLFIDLVFVSAFRPIPQEMQTKSSRNSRANI